MHVQALNGRVHASLDNGYADGFKCDDQGNLWSSCGDGVCVYDPTGALIGKIILPGDSAQPVNQLAFADNRLVIMHHEQVLMLPLATQGIAGSAGSV